MLKMQNKNKIRFATIGTSWICEEFIETAKTFSEIEIYSVYSRNADRAKAFSEKYGAVKHYSNLEEMASDPLIDAVYIASPNSHHKAQSILFMEHGKAVFCEKPIASNFVEFTEMRSCAEKHGVLLMEAYKSMLMPGLLTVKDNLRKLGRIRSVFAVFSKYSSRYDAHLRGENVNTFNAEFSNGAAVDLGVYCIYPVLYMFGVPNLVKAVGAVVPGGVDATDAVIMQYDGFVASLLFSKVSNSYLPCEIQGEDGTMVIDRFNIPGNIEIVYKNGSREKLNFTQREDSMCYEIEEFIRCYLENKEPKVNTLSLSAEGTKVLDEIRRQIGVVYPADEA